MGSVLGALLVLVLRRKSGDRPAWCLLQLCKLWNCARTRTEEYTLVRCGTARNVLQKSSRVFVFFRVSQTTVGEVNSWGPAVEKLVAIRCNYKVFQMV